MRPTRRRAGSPGFSASLLPSLTFLFYFSTGTPETSPAHLLMNAIEPPSWMASSPGPSSSLGQMKQRIPSDKSGSSELSLAWCQLPWKATYALLLRAWLIYRLRVATVYKLKGQGLPQ